MTVGAGMSGMAGMMMAPAAWTAGYAGLMFVMWWVMIVGMMLPTAAKVPGQGLAAWPAWRLPHGDRARHLLLGVLLVLDGPPVLRRRHEPVLDCWAGGVRPDGKGDPAGPVDWTARRHRRRCVG